MTNIAILGFGVVGCGTAELIEKNRREVEKLGGDEIYVKYVLDLRDFPDSPFADRVVHDFNIILNDDTVSNVIEVMGGSHPAYEYTAAALRKGKNVITSNKEVVANFGDELLKIAEESCASYRFEASVGGGIPVLSTIINCVRQNKILEVRGILNGTTNYILTKMFSFGDSFEDSLLDAQKKGYAERNPDADILGTDAARKITILMALTTGKLVSPEKIHTEGITNIRKADVTAADRLGCSIKLVGRCINTDGGTYVAVAPFMIGKDSPLSNVHGVYNAIEVIGEPLGNVMFYGKGAGAGATASAVVGDLVQAMRYGSRAICPKFESSDEFLNFDGFVSKTYIATDAKDFENVKRVFEKFTAINSDEVSFVCDEMSEKELNEKLSKLEALGTRILSRIRLL